MRRTKAPAKLERREVNYGGRNFLFNFFVVAVVVREALRVLFVCAAEEEESSRLSVSGLSFAVRFFFLLLVTSKLLYALGLVCK